MFALPRVPDCAAWERETSMNDSHERGHDNLSKTAEWAVYRCVNGCVHLRLQHLTLTFSTCEFAQLVELLGEAYARLVVRDAVAYVGSH